MKELWKNGIIVLLIIGVLYILYLRECKRDDCPPDGQILVAESVWDSILTLAEKPPEVKIETLRIKGDPIYIPSQPIPTPLPDPKDSTINVYNDSLVRKDVDVHINLRVRGELLNRTWWYKPITMTVDKEVTIYVPKIVEVEKVVEKAANGFYLYGLAGGNTNSFLFGGGLDYITKKNTELGYLYQRFGNENFHSVKLGVKLFPNK